MSSAEYFTQMLVLWKNEKTQFHLLKSLPNMLSDQKKGVNSKEQDQPTRPCLIGDYIRSLFITFASRKHTYIILTPLNPTFI